MASWKLIPFIAASLLGALLSGPGSPGQGRSPLAPASVVPTEGAPTSGCGADWVFARSVPLQVELIPWRERAVPPRAGMRMGTATTAVRIETDPCPPI